MAHLGLALDPTTHDLTLDSDNNLAMVEDAQAVGQHCKQRLLTYEGEWFLDGTVGVPWFQYVFVRPFDEVIAEAIVKTAALDTDGIVELTSFAMELVDTTRGIVVDLEAITVYDANVGVTL